MQQLLLLNLSYNNLTGSMAQLQSLWLLNMSNVKGGHTA